jgi:prepilin-type N-terminal cleavage/methylation domain-containing protein
MQKRFKISQVSPPSHAAADRAESGKHSPAINYEPFSIRSSANAFTLIELMISIALVLLLILGVNQIFTYTTQAVGAGQALNAAIRDSRAFGSSIATDTAAMVPPGSGINDSACLIIANYSQPGFRDKKDLSTDPDQNPWTRDLKGNGNEGDPNVPGDIIQQYTYNYRNRRTDVLSFFARDLFHRQTGNPGTFVDNMASQEAWVWYGHLWLPDNSGNYTAQTYPGQGFAVNGGVYNYQSQNPSVANPNNFFSTQMVLGRVAILLSEKVTSSNGSATIIDNQGYPQWFMDRVAGATAADLTPLSGGPPNTSLPNSAAMLNTSAVATTNNDPGGSSPPTYIYNSRVDLASTSISNYQQKLLNYVTEYPIKANPSAKWWDYLMDGNLITPPYYSRFQCNPILAKPMQAVDVAHASPYMLAGCSQFTVEYAGDYLQQDNVPTDTYYGYDPSSTTVGKAVPPTGGSDGQIDYVLIPPTGDSPLPPRNQWRKQILWYGMPRNTSGTGTVNAFANGDVIPLTYWLTQGAGTPTNASFERYWPNVSFDNNGNVPLSPTAPSAPYTPYVCAWGPTDQPPSLIRITITLDDPTGRLPDGQTYQYVFAVPPQ